MKINYTLNDRKYLFYLNFYRVVVLFFVFEIRYHFCVKSVIGNILIIYMIKYFNKWTKIYLHEHPKKQTFQNEIQVKAGISIMNNLSCRF